MSWLDQIQHSLTIATGDGQSYTPNWLNAKKIQEYNLSEFEFPNTPGTLVKRNQPLGVKYALEIYFQGTDHLDVARAFHKSANDPRPWTIQHPFYGIIKVQPVALEFDNSELNVTKITGPVIETIVDDNPITSIQAIDAISIQKIAVDNSMQDIIIRPKAADVTILASNNSKNFKLGVPIIKIPSEFEDYNHAFNIANAAVSTAIADASLAMTLTIAFINKPALFSASLQVRISTLIAQFGNLRQGIGALTDPNSKYLYEITAGSIISSLCLASSIVESDLSSADVLSVMTDITNAYDDYLSDINSLMTLNGGNTTSFIGDGDALLGLNDLVNLAVSNLFDIALTSKQQRSIVTDRDTNIILLTHELYGLDELDANIDELVTENNIGLSEILQIKKGRKIVYYI